MKRVSSRQRLVSWDQFEANAQQATGDCSSYEDSDAAASPDSIVAAYRNSHLAPPIIMPTDVEGSERFLIPQTQSMDSETSAVHSTTSASSLKRKRHGSRSSKKCTSPQETASIEAFPWEVSTDSVMMIAKEEVPSLDTMNDDVKLRIFAFLTTDDVRTMMEVSKESFYKLIASDQACLLWKQYCSAQWPFCEQESTNYVTSIKAEHDYYSKKNDNDNNTNPLQAAGNGGYKRHELNFNAVLQSATETCPTSIDESIFTPCRWSRSLRRYRARRTPMATELKTIRWTDESTGKEESAVQFTGTIGSGDRCIRSDNPFGRPQKVVAPTKEKENPFSAPKAALSRLFHRGNQRQGGSSSPTPRSPQRFFLEHLRRGAANRSSLDNGSLLSLPELQWTPFVVPFSVASTVDGKQTMSVTPRLVNYYEVSILPPELGNGHGIDTDNRNSGSDCVAVGISTNQFSLHTRMVGWDDFSFGYHGDDGGVFHHTGHMLREYGPNFGAGDTVGCGIDYHRNVIFFTLNGKFLGDAFSNLDAHQESSGRNFYDQDWYPTVGIDTKCLVQCNFGTERPFAFDLEKYMREKHGQVQRYVQHQCDQLARTKLC